MVCQSNFVLDSALERALKISIARRGETWFLNLSLVQYFIPKTFFFQNQKWRKETLQKQVEVNLKFSRHFHVYWMCSRNFWTSEFYSQMHNLDHTFHTPPPPSEVDLEEQRFVSSIFFYGWILCSNLKNWHVKILWLFECNFIFLMLLQDIYF